MSIGLELAGSNNAAWNSDGMLVVYILRCRDGSLYTGAAKDLARRLGQHHAGTASKYTRARLPVRLVWSRRVRTWRQALRLERRIKQLTRAEKLALVAGLGRTSRRTEGMKESVCRAKTGFGRPGRDGPR